MKLPKARTENLLEQNLENETLIYDLTINKAFNLNETSTVVYKACGQNMTFEDLKRKHKFTDDLIFFALDELGRNNLLDGEYLTPLSGMTRREIIRRVGLSSMILLPVISTLLAPNAARAASVCTADICVPAGQNFCAGCAGRAVITDRYAGNSGCTGPIISSGLLSNCPANGNPITSTSDRRIRSFI